MHGVCKAPEWHRTALVYDVAHDIEYRWILISNNMDVDYYVPVQ